MNVVKTLQKISLGNACRIWFGKSPVQSDELCTCQGMRHRRDLPCTIISDRRSWPTPSSDRKRKPMSHRRIMCWRWVPVGNCKAWYYPTHPTCEWHWQWSSAHVLVGQLGVLLRTF